MRKTLWLVVLAATATALDLGAVTLPAGTPVTVRLERALSSDRNGSGEQFTARLASPLVANGRVIANQGSEVRGRILRAGHSGASADLVLELNELVLANGWLQTVQTEPLQRRSEARPSGGQGSNIPAMGTTIGAAVGKGRGAALGAAIGASLRELSVAGGHTQPVVIQPKALLVFRLR